MAIVFLSMVVIVLSIALAASERDKKYAWRCEGRAWAQAHATLVREVIR